MHYTFLIKEESLTESEQADLMLAFSLAASDKTFSRFLSQEAYHEEEAFAAMIRHDPKAFYAFMSVSPQSHPPHLVATGHDICTRYWRAVVTCYRSYQRGKQ